MGRAAGAAARHHRPAVRLAEQHLRSTIPRTRLAELRRAPEATPEVWLAQARAALELRRHGPGRPDRQPMLADDPWEWRAVWVSGLAALDSGDFARGAVGLQRGLRPGARRAGAQAGPGPGLRARRRGGDRRGALPDLRQHRRQLRRPGGLRHGPDPRRARGRRGSGRGARPGAVDQPQLPRGPAAAGRAALRVRPGSAGRWPRRWTACRAYALDPREQAAADRGDPGAGAGRGRPAGPEDRREDRAVPGPRRLAARRAGSHLPAAGRAPRATSGSATRWSTRPTPCEGGP